MHKFLRAARGTSLLRQKKDVPTPRRRRNNECKEEKKKIIQTLEDLIFLQEKT